MMSSSEDTSLESSLSLLERSESTEESIAYDDVISIEEENFSELDDITTGSVASSDSSITSESFTSSCSSSICQMDDDIKLNSENFVATEDEVEVDQQPEVKCKADTSNDDLDDGFEIVLAKEDLPSLLIQELNMEEKKPQLDLDQPVMEDSEESFDMGDISEDEGDLESLSKAFSAGASLAVAAEEEEEETAIEPWVDALENEASEENDEDFVEQKEQVKTVEEAVNRQDASSASSVSSADLMRDIPSCGTPKRNEQRANMNGEVFFASEAEMREKKSNMYHYEYVDEDTVQAKPFQMPTSSPRSDARGYGNHILPSPPTNQSPGGSSVPLSAEFRQAFPPPYTPSCPPFDPTDATQWHFWQWAMNGAPWAGGAATAQPHYGVPYGNIGAAHQFNGSSGPAYQAFQLPAQMPQAASAGPSHTRPFYDNRVRPSSYRPPAGSGQAFQQLNRASSAPWSRNSTAKQSEEEFDTRGQFQAQGSRGSYGSRNSYPNNNQQSNNSYSNVHQSRGDFPVPHYNHRPSSVASDPRGFREEFPNRSVTNSSAGPNFQNKKPRFYHGGSNNQYQQGSRGGHFGNQQQSGSGASNQGFNNPTPSQGYSRGGVTGGRDRSERSSERSIRSYQQSRPNFSGPNQRTETTYGRDHRDQGRGAGRAPLLGSESDKLSLSDSSPSGTAIRKLGNDQWFEFTDLSNPPAPSRGSGGRFRPDSRPSTGGRSDDFNNHNRGGDYRGPNSAPRDVGYRGGNSGTAGFRGGYQDRQQQSRLPSNQVSMSSGLGFNPGGRAY